MNVRVLLGVFAIVVVVLLATVCATPTGVSDGRTAAVSRALGVDRDLMAAARSKHKKTKKLTVPTPKSKPTGKPVNAQASIVKSQSRCRDGMIRDFGGRCVQAYLDIV